MNHIRCRGMGGGGGGSPVFRGNRAGSIVSNIVFRWIIANLLPMMRGIFRILQSLKGGSD